MLMRGGRSSPEQLAMGVRLVHEAADAGCLDAQTTLGCFYAEGFAGVPRNMGTAVRWFEIAAKAGDARAAFNLGIFKLQGNGVPMDKPGAGRLFKQAGEAGNVDAMINLATMLVKGDGIPRDLQLGAQWLVKSAQSGGKMEELVDKIQRGSLDNETAIKLTQMIEKLRDVNKENPFMKPDGTGKTRDLDVD